MQKYERKQRMTAGRGALIEMHGIHGRFWRQECNG